MVASITELLTVKPVGRLELWDSYVNEKQL